MTAPIHSSLEESSRWTTQTVSMGPEILDRMERAVAKVRERLLRATQALNAAGIPYAVVGGNAVASWVATIDEGAVRNTREVDLLVRRSDLPAVSDALERAGFVSGTLLDVVMFRDGEQGKPSEAIHLLFAGEKTRQDHLLPAPAIETVDDPANFRVIMLDSLVLMKLMSNRRKDQVHVQDLINVGLVDASWLSKFPPQLADRLKRSEEHTSELQSRVDLVCRLLLEKKKKQQRHQHARPAKNGRRRQTTRNTSIREARRSRSTTRNSTGQSHEIPTRRNAGRSTAQKR